MTGPNDRRLMSKVSLRCVSPIIQNLSHTLHAYSGSVRALGIMWTTKERVRKTTGLNGFASQLLLLYVHHREASHLSKVTNVHAYARVENRTRRLRFLCAS